MWAGEAPSPIPIRYHCLPTLVVALAAERTKTRPCWLGSQINYWTRNLTRATTTITRKQVAFSIAKHNWAKEHFKSQAPRAFITNAARSKVMKFYMQVCNTIVPPPPTPAPVQIGADPPCVTEVYYVPTSWINKKKLRLKLTSVHRVKIVEAGYPCQRHHSSRWNLLAFINHHHCKSNWEINHTIKVSNAKVSSADSSQVRVLLYDDWWPC